MESSKWIEAIVSKSNPEEVGSWNDEDGSKKDTYAEMQVYIYINCDEGFEFAVFSNYTRDEPRRER